MRTFSMPRRPSLASLNVAWLAQSPWAIVVILVGHVGLWTVYSIIAQASGA